MGKAQGEVQPQGDKMFKNKKESQPKVVNQGYKIKNYFSKIIQNMWEKNDSKRYDEWKRLARSKSTHDAKNIDLTWKSKTEVRHDDTKSISQKIQWAKSANHLRIIYASSTHLRR